MQGSDSNLLSNCVLRDFTRIALLGTGVLGRVYVCKYKNNDDVYSLKEMFKSEIMNKKQTQAVISEKNLLLQCDHPFIVKVSCTNNILVV